MSAANILIQEIQSALKNLFQEEVPTNNLQIQQTKKEFKGDLTLVVFPLLKITKKSPEQSSQEIGEYLLKNAEMVSDFNVVKGFLNISFTDEFWLFQLDNWQKKPEFGMAEYQSGKTYMVEYSSPNTNKPLHLGHLRNIFLGDAVANILKANGHKVCRTQIINDRGIHICKSMLAWQQYGNGENPETNNLKGDHLIGKYYVAFDKAYKEQILELMAGGMEKEIAEKEAPLIKQAQEMLVKWEAKDEEIYNLWKTMNGWVYDGFEKTYRRMGVTFDKLYYESDTYLTGKKAVEYGLSENKFYTKEDGSVWVDLSSEKMDDKLLLRADGTSVYMTQDIGTAMLRYEDFPDLSGLIYTVADEQNHHFKVLFSILKKLGYSWANECYHLSYGMVDLPTGRMKSREGTVVDADDLMESVVNDARMMTQERGHIEGLSEDEKNELYETIGLGGLKYYLLKVDPKKRMTFNPEESIELNGNTGPFVQYTYARIQSVLKKGEAYGLNIDKSLLLSESERDLIKSMSLYPEIIQEAAMQFSPSHLVNYVYDLVKCYNSFFQSNSILKAETTELIEMRLALSSKVGEIIATSMNLLGIKVPQQM